MKENKSIKRVMQVMDSQGLNTSSFEKKLDLKNGTLNTAFTRESTIKDVLLNKILNLFEEVDPVWLLTGEGTMIKAKSDKRNDLSDYSDLEIIEYQAKNIERFSELSLFTQLVTNTEVLNIKKELRDIKSNLGD